MYFMHTYSQNIARFIEEINLAAKKILALEMKVKVLGARFLEWSGKYSYPINIVIYNDKSILGYFDSEFLELGFHEKLLFESKENLHNVIRHELAHYMAFILYGPCIAHHGKQFKELCMRFGWGEEVFSATLSLKGAGSNYQVSNNTALRKIQKLMALCQSGNIHEKEAAILKSQQMLLKHNIESKYLNADGQQRFFVKRIMRQKQKNAKMHAIAAILETFFVHIIFNRSKEYVYLEILGELANVEIAEYVANVLNFEIERLWKEVKVSANVKGMVAKNSFFRGIAKGYCEKVQALKKKHSSETSTALMVIEKKLIDAKNMVYSRLSSSKQRGRLCSFSSNLGLEMGRKLNISPALKSSFVSPLQIGMN